MTVPIQPALTPEEWKRSPGVYGWDDASVFLDFGRPPEESDVQRPHAVAALCLSGQSFGFSRDDIELLNHAANLLGGFRFPGDSDPLSPDGARRLRELRSRIAALLPPSP